MLCCEGAPDRFPALGASRTVAFAFVTKRADLSRKVKFMSRKVKQGRALRHYNIGVKAIDASRLVAEILCMSFYRIANY
jgi:hypothetical protein